MSSQYPPSQYPPPQYGEQTYQQPAPTKKPRRIFRWVFLAVQVIFVIWIFGGLSDAGDNCAGEVGSALEACEAGTAVGAGIGVFMILVLWVIVDFILAISYLIFRKK